MAALGWLVHFGPHPLAVFDAAAKKIRPLGAALAPPKVETVEDLESKEHTDDAS